MYFYLLVAVQVFCAYHAYKHQKPYYWFFVIMFLPLVGCIVYIITQMYTKADVDRIQSDITKVVNPTKQVKDLQQRLQFSDSYANRIDLADAYFEINDFQNAIEHYQHTLQDTVQDDTHARQQLVLSYFKLGDYQNVIANAEVILNKPEFQGSKSQFCYGLSLKELGKFEEAKTQLKAIDRPYSNYAERLELAKFYLENDNKTEGEDLLNEIYAESQYMTKPNRRMYRETINEVERILKSL